MFNDVKGVLHLNRCMCRVKMEVRMGGGNTRRQRRENTYPLTPSLPPQTLEVGRRHLGRRQEHRVQAGQQEGALQTLPDLHRLPYEGARQGDEGGLLGH